MSLLHLTGKGLPTIPPLKTAQAKKLGHFQLYNKEGMSVEFLMRCKLLQFLQQPCQNLQLSITPCTLDSFAHPELPQWLGKVTRVCGRKEFTRGQGRSLLPPEHRPFMPVQLHLCWEPEENHYLVKSAFLIKTSLPEQKPSTPQAPHSWWALPLPSDEVQEKESSFFSCFYFERV